MPSQVVLRFVTATMMSLLLSAFAGADFRAEISSNTASVGDAITLSVSIDYRDKVEIPEELVVDGADVTPQAPLQSQNIVTTNGRRTITRSVRVRYIISPQRVGRLHIPELTFRVDGEEQVAGPFDVAVTQGTQPLFVDVTCSKPRVYVGEPLDVTLRIWIKPFRAPNLSKVLSDRDMWGLVSIENSEFGLFSKSIRDLLLRQQRPASRSMVRTIDAATNETYYVFQITQRCWPLRENDLGLGDIRIKMRYPTGLREDFFDLVMTGARDLEAVAEVPDITILPIPTEDRPPDYRGAVGNFEIKVTADPATVSVGDPITITLAITDRGNPPSDLSTLQPPPFTEGEAFQTNFRIPSNPLAGIVEGRVKTFTQSIRPLRSEIDEIPPIRFVSFDPKEEKFVVHSSNPIPIHVNPADLITGAEIAQGLTPMGGDRRAAGLTSRAGGIRANIADPALVLAESFQPSMLVIALAGGVPPVCFGAAMALLAWRRRLNSDPVARRRREAFPAARQRLRAARNAPDRVRAAAISSAVTGYIADQLDLPPGAATPQHCLQRLHEAIVLPPTLDTLQSLLRQCEVAQFQASDHVQSAELEANAEACLRELERVDWSAVTSEQYRR